MKKRLTPKERREIRKKGWVVNVAETAAQVIFKRRGIEFLRRGYPDYMVVKDGKIMGFIEVKPHHGKELHKEQKRFQAFCEVRGIPFMKWTPDDGEDAIAGFFGAL